MWESYLTILTENLEEMHFAMASRNNESERALVENLEVFNRLLGKLKRADEDRLAKFFVINCNKDFDDEFNRLKAIDQTRWVEEAERLAMFFLHGFSLGSNGHGWGAVVILCRFKELVCRNIKQENTDLGLKHVPASAFVYAMQ